MIRDNFLKWIPLIIINGAFVLGLSCSLSSLGGSGSEAPNSLTLISRAGHVYGSSKPDLSVGMYKQSYVPYNDSGIYIKTLSDKNGLFDFGHLDSGIYNVVADDTSYKQGAFIADIIVGDDIGPDTLLSSLNFAGTITGIVHDTSGTAFSSLPVYIAGSPFFAITDANGHFDLGNLPSGDFRLLSKEVFIQNPGRTGSRIFIVDTVFTISKGGSQNLGTVILK